MPLTPEALYLQLGQLIGQMPAFGGFRGTTPEMHQWLARAVALVEEGGDISDAITLRGWADTMVAMELDLVVRRGLINKIRAILYRALARAELKAPASAQGAFIPAGNSFEAFAAVGNVLGTATADVLMVDPYADEKLLTDFAMQATESVSMRVLTDDTRHKPTLRPAAQRWKQQYGPTRLLEVRLATAPLHDRLIVVDNAVVWMVGQSFKDLAENAPTSIVRVDAGTAALKISAYANLWERRSLCEQSNGSGSQRCVVENARQPRNAQCGDAWGDVYCG